MTFDAMSNSPSHSQLNTRKFGRRIWLFIRSHLRLFSRHPCNCCLHYNHCFPQKWLDTMQECFECRVSWRHSSNTPMRVHLQVPYQGAQLKDDQSFNTSMSTVRTAVEWVFADITSYFSFLNFRKNLKIGLSPIGKMYAVCALL